MKVYGGRRGWLQGSYTVEAAFVVPVILGILFALLYFLFYEHDKVVLYGNVKRGVLASAQEGQLPDDMQWKKSLQENLWMATVSEGSVSKTAMHVKGSGEAQMKLVIPVMELFLDPEQSIRCNYHCDYWQPEQILRQKDMVSGIKEK